MNPPRPHRIDDQAHSTGGPLVDRPALHRILLLAYACGPGRGSEESVGWDTADALARRGFDVTILTRTSERKTCPSLSDRHQNLSIVCHDIPSRWQDRLSGWGKIGVEAGYLAWLLSARPVIVGLHAQNRFHSAQHVTYARYWMPSPLQVLDIPWILGPVGGGESIPSKLRSTLSPAGRAFEWLRDLMRRLGELSPAVRRAASGSSVALANTEETAVRLRAMGASRVEIMNSAALSDLEFQRLASLADERADENRSGFVSIGRLLDWKGFHIGLLAFASSGSSELFTIVGTGPFEARLRKLARDLGIESQVRFAGVLPRSEVFSILSSARALVHPSLHESGGFVCLEAMAAGTPVVCIKIGGPGLFVKEGTGIAVPASNPDRTVSEIAAGMRSLYGNADSGLGNSASAHVERHHVMSVKAARLAELHRSIAQTSEHYTGSTISRLDPRNRDRKPERADCRTSDSAEGAVRQ